MPSLPATTAGEGGLYFSFRPSRLNVSPSETKIEPDRRLIRWKRSAECSYDCASETTISNELFLFLSVCLRLLQGVE